MSTATKIYSLWTSMSSCQTDRSVIHSGEIVFRFTGEQNEIHVEFKI